MVNALLKKIWQKKLGDSDDNRPKIFTTKVVNNDRTRTRSELISLSASKSVLHCFLLRVTLFIVVIKFEKCIVALLNDAVDQLQMSTSAYRIIKHQLVIR